MASTAPSGLALSIAPEFDPSMGWINTAPMTLAGLRGHPVVLLFWNAGSAHCHNALQTVGALAARFRESAAFIAVHDADIRAAVCAKARARRSRWSTTATGRPGSSTP